MDELGVLTERFGLKPQGKSAPMAASRRPVNTNDGQSWNVGFDSDVNPNLSSYSDDRHGFYHSGKDTKTQNSGRSNNYDDIFGGPSKQSDSHGGSSAFDIGSFFSGSNANSSSFHTNDDDDIFGVRGLNSDDIFGSFCSPPNPSAPIDDLLADFVGADAKPKFSNRNKFASGFDDLIPGFGPSTTSTFTSSEDPFAVLEPTTTTSTSNKASSHGGDDFSIFDDLSSMFGDVQILEEFEEVEAGESEERRKARIERLQRTHDRMTKALADLNQRDFQSQQEQEERRRIAETLDPKIKRWAAGKEGNMRALLSSLQYVLWPECGWEPVSLTDIITSSSVKKVYRKATLYVHPDKVQQKGATLEQKYTAHKIFDLLNEAWNKFKKEELSKC